MNLAYASLPYADLHAAAAGKGPLQLVGVDALVHARQLGLVGDGLDEV